MLTYDKPAMRKAAKELVELFHEYQKRRNPICGRDRTLDDERTIFRSDPRWYYPSTRQPGHPQEYYTDLWEYLTSEFVAEHIAAASRAWRVYENVAENCEALADELLRVAKTVE